MTSAIKRAADLVPGGLAGIGRALGGLSRRTVWAWHQRGRVPAAYCPKIEMLTKGAVTCEELNPGFDWAGFRRALEDIDGLSIERRGALQEAA